MVARLSLSLDPADLSPGLYLVPTPLGNLRDITLRALETLMGCDVLLCEDTRMTAKLLRHYGIDAAAQRYDDHASEGQRRMVLDRLESEAVALVSDAGTPLINDPGFKLARDALAEGKAVHALPGPSAPILALTLSGQPTDTFTYGGYLPNKAGARAKACARLAQISHTIIVFESVHRVAASLADLAQAMGERPAALCREMTKVYEEVDRAPLNDLAARWAERPAKGEFVIVIGPGGAEESVDIDTLLAQALAAGQSVKEAVQSVTAQTGAPRKAVYQAALAQRDAC
ncbi:MAG: 16S rRNA (cytidine(1402)-2'-O)-methyltransferase [Pseudomonadota bacterium]